VEEQIVKLQIALCVVLGLIVGCGSGDSSTDSNNAPQAETDTSVAASNNSDPTATETPVSDENVTVPNNDAGSNADTVGNPNASLVGTWVSCDRIGGPMAWSFTETTYRTYFAPELLLENTCDGLLTLEKSTQGGTYKVIGTGTSEEGLSVVYVEFQATDVFGGIPSNDVPIAVNSIHVDGDTMYLGFSGSTIENTSTNLSLDDPLVRQ